MNFPDDTFRATIYMILAFVDWATSDFWHCFRARSQNLLSSQLTAHTITQYHKALMAAHSSTESPAGLPVDNPSKSYWLSEPSEILLGHRTTKDLPQAADVVIVGSGITGAFAAHCVKEKAPNLNVVMLEAREACSGATGRNGGHCQPAYYNCPPHVAAFEHRTYSYLKALVESHSIPCDWHVTTGVHGYYSLELFNATRKIIEKIQEEHPDIGANITIVTKGNDKPSSSPGGGEKMELTLEGLRVGAAEGAIVQQNAGSLWPYKLVAFVLERLLAADGFNLQTNTPVTGLKRGSAPMEVSSRDPGAGEVASRGWTVRTSRGDISARHVLLATNAYTSYLLPQFADIIVPVKGQVSSLRPPPQPAKGPLNIEHTFYFVSDLADRRDDYLVQRPPPGAELIYGGGRIRAKGHGLSVWDDSTIDEPVAQYLRDELGGLMDLSIREEGRTQGEHDIQLPKQDLEPTFQWAGIMGYSRDGWPWVGPVPTSAGGGDGLWLCAGYTGGGMPNAALCAKAVVNMMIPGNNDGDNLADQIDLPPEYILTEDRLKKARTCETIIEADIRGAFMLDLDIF
ncbi:FAD dependent oxidoreductase [Xylaria bambusicola]|uniref:FAD dependent oxidoreductase n=1 Tax=Xylaria bambusicola TaxID=326684 RepID=UPI0020089C56|nr:FAD dependent oxidoreductase [Xylaria bambusicola]KAI0506442.1 FAD dependent oxidoreductase [Xylaria bambusicola]